MRRALAILTMLAASACGPLGLPTAVDAIPFDARPATQPFADGVYCGLDEDEEDDSRVVVRSAPKEGDSACMGWTWDATRRLFVVTKLGDGIINAGDLSVAELGDGLLLMQFPETKPEDEEADEKPWAFLLWVAMAEGEAVALVPLSYGEEVRTRASAYPGIVFSADEEDPAPAPKPQQDAAEDVEVIAPPAPVYYISAGDPQDIREFARGIIVDAMRAVAAAPEEERNIPEHGAVAPVMVRAEAGAPDHPPTPEQLRDIDVLTKRFLALGEP